MASTTPPIDLLDLVHIARRQWPILIGVPVAAAALAYFVAPSPPATVSATAVLAINEHPSRQVIDQAIEAGSATGRVVSVQEDGTRVTASTTAPSEAEAKASIDATMAPFISAQILEGEHREDAIATIDRLEKELDLLQSALGVLTSSPPNSGTGEYNPATYADSVLPLSSRITELSERLFGIYRSLDEPLAVSGNVTYNYTAQRSSSRSILIAVAALTAAFATLLWLVALEALRRREAPVRS